MEGRDSRTYELIESSMNRTPRQTRSPPTTDGREQIESVDDVLAALSDPDCRSILAATVEPKTAAEVIEACDLSMSTGYRKLNQLSETPLLREQTRVDPVGGNPSEYVCTAEHLELDVGAGGVELTVDTTDETDIAEPSFAGTPVSAD